MKLGGVGVSSHGYMATEIWAPRKKNVGPKIYGATVEEPQILTETPSDIILQLHNKEKNTNQKTQCQQ